jgi:hypothetical protein
VKISDGPTIIFFRSPTHPMNHRNFSSPSQVSRWHKQRPFKTTQLGTGPALSSNQPLINESSPLNAHWKNVITVGKYQVQLTRTNYGQVEWSADWGVFFRLFHSTRGMQITAI